MSKLTRKEKEHKLLLLKEKAKRTAKNNFWQFCLYMDHDFFKLRESILKNIAIDMQRLIKPIPPMTELDILNISLPPRTGKSYLCTLFCGWCLGNFPEESVMRNTVTAKLYFKFSSDLKSIIAGETHNKKYNEVFPRIKMATSALEGWKLEGSKQGISYFGAGIEGSIIGFGASMLSILDDSVKDEFDALNANSLDKKWGWYGSAADSREEKTCKKLFIGTRWSKYDIVGRLKELGYFNKENAKEIVIPAIIDGKSYCEEIHTTKKLARTKRITSRIIWLAEWMQEPIEAEGLLFPPHELKYFRKTFIQDRKADAIIAWGDVADEGQDFFAYPVGYLIGENVYISDVVFTQEKIEISKGKVVKATIKNNVELSYFESNNGGKGYALEVARLLQGMGSKTTVKWQANRQNKETRILVGSEIVKKNFYFLDPEDYEEGSEYDLFMKQFTTYSHLGKNIHDDACFEAGTKISTPYGDKNIEDIKKGDYVLTPFGIRKVLNSGITGYKNTISNIGLKATYNHKIFTKNNGFISLDALKCLKDCSIISLEEMILWKYKKLLYSMESNTNLWEGRKSIILVSQQQTKGGKTLKDFMLRFGNFIINRKFQKGIVFITKMGILLTTTLITWNVYKLGNIYQCILKTILKMKNIFLKIKKFSIKQEKKQANGIEAKKALSGIKSNIKKVWKKLNIKHLFVSSVEKNLKANSQEQCFAVDYVEKDTIEKTKDSKLNANVLYVEKILSNTKAVQVSQLQKHVQENVQHNLQQNQEEETKKVPVYNITVDKDHVYYANGVLVSNCDAINGLKDLYLAITKKNKNTGKERPSGCI